MPSTFSAELEGDGWTLRVTDKGLLHLTVGDIVVCDRGALHEWIDLRHWGGRERDGQPTETVGAPQGMQASDYYRHHHHWIQTSAHDVTVEQYPKHRSVAIHGVLGTPEGRRGGARFQTIASVTADAISLSVGREYLEDCPTVGDNSICFLSPPSFAARFLARGDTYATRDDGWSEWRELPHEPGALVETHIPKRLRTQLDSNGRAWAILMGEDAGFGVLVWSAERMGHLTGGEIRCTRPRPPAEKKFDEIEFQWPRGPAHVGDTETAIIELIPGKTAAEIAAKLDAIMTETGA